MLYYVSTSIVADGNATNFSLASMTLDASGKIYGYRVDAVHQDVFRLVSGIGVGKNIVNDGGIPAAPEELDQVSDLIVYFSVKVVARIPLLLSFVLCEACATLSP